MAPDQPWKGDIDVPDPRHDGPHGRTAAHAQLFIVGMNASLEAVHGYTQVKHVAVDLDPLRAATDWAGAPLQGPVRDREDS